MNSSIPRWSYVLQRILQIPAERERLAAALGISASTLTRWMSGRSIPRHAHLMQLLQVLQPGVRRELIEALISSYPELRQVLEPLHTEQITPDFFAEVLHLRARTPVNLRFWRISEAILKQIVSLFDPQELGLVAKVVQCMPPAQKDGKVRSMHERLGKGTPPWPTHLEHEMPFLGQESLCGAALEQRYPASCNDLRKRKQFAGIRNTPEVSAAAQPLQFEQKFAGCLLVCSTQPGYFSQERLRLLAIFGELLALAFERHEFYSSQELKLRTLPPAESQYPIIATFQKRLRRHVRELSYRPQGHSYQEIELQVWQEIEEEILTLTPPPLHTI